MVYLRVSSPRFWNTVGLSYLVIFISLKTLKELPRIKGLLYIFYGDA